MRRCIYSTIIAQWLNSVENAFLVCKFRTYRKARWDRNRIAETVPQLIQIVDGISNRLNSLLLVLSYDDLLILLRYDICVLINHTLWPWNPISWFVQNLLPHEALWVYLQDSSSLVLCLSLTLVIKQDLSVCVAFEFRFFFTFVFNAYLWELAATGKHFFLTVISLDHLEHALFLGDLSHTAQVWSHKPSLLFNF